ncbi:MAG: hypothetical protein AAF628_21245 [Planctomycetota bacterium]
MIGGFRFGALLVGGVLLYFGVVARSHWREIERLQESVSACYARSTGAEQKAAQLAHVHGDVERLEGWLAELEELLTPRDDTAPLLLRTSARLRELGLEAEHAETLAPTPRPPFVSESVRLSVSGSLVDLLALLRSIEDEQPPSRVTSLRVKPAAQPGLVSAELAVARFWRRGS